MSYDAIERMRIKRQQFALECNSLVERPYQDFIFCDDYSGAVLFPYVPCSAVARSSLPDTLISGPLLESEFWTDGIFLQKTKRLPRETEVFIQFDKPVETLMHKGLRVQSAFILIHADFHNIPQVLVVTERKWSLFSLCYLDFAVKQCVELENVELWLNTLDTGCILFKKEEEIAYLSKVTPPSLTQPKIDVLLEKMNAIYRY